MKRIGFIGAGKMATALISCIYRKKIAKSIIASDINNKNLDSIRKQFSIKTTKDNKEVVKKSDIVFVCVKPQDVDSVLNEIRNIIKNQLIVSIAAGIRIKHLESKLKSSRNEVSPELKYQKSKGFLTTLENQRFSMNRKFLSNKRVIRVMPNINCIAGEMAAGFSAGKYATKKDIDDVSKILNSAGVGLLLKEGLLDAVTAVSGSGPAFFAYFIKAFEEAGIKNGLPKEIAFRLAAQTALGTAKLLIEKGISPDELIAMVASKKGTTEAGLKVLEKYKTKEILIEAIDAALKRSKELGK